MKVRIKEYIKNGSIRYKVQYLWLGFIWHTYDNYGYKDNAVGRARFLEAREFPRVLTVEEAEAELKKEKEQK